MKFRGKPLKPTAISAKVRGAAHAIKINKPLAENKHAGALHWVYNSLPDSGGGQS
jgi:hypothetical protein